MTGRQKQKRDEDKKKLYEDAARTDASLLLWIIKNRHIHLFFPPKSL